MQAIKTRYKKVTSTRKGRVIFLSVISLIFVAIAGGIWYWNANKQGIIRDQLESAIREKSAGLYRVKYNDLRLDEVAGFLSVSNMTLRYDSVMFQRMKKNKNAPSFLISLTIPTITVEGVKTTRALIDDEIVGRKVEILNAEIEIIYTNAGKDSARNAPTKDVYEQILGNLDLITMDTVNIINARITTRNFDNGKPVVSFTGVSLSLHDLQVDSLASLDETRNLFSKALYLDCNEVKWTADNNLYRYTFSGLAVNSVTRQLKISAFSMTPTMGEEQFVKAIPTQDDRFDFDFKNISIANLDISEFFDERIFADELNIGSASFKIYRDLARPRDKKNRVGRFPHQVIDDIPLPFNIRRMKVSNGFVEYKERNHITRKSGKVQFHDIHATFSNFTNMKTVLGKNNIMNVKVTSRFMDMAPLNVDWTFYLLDAKGKFKVKGTLGKIDATKLNSLTEPMGPATIKEGMINSLAFNLSGHDYGMDGTVDFRYEDLKVTLLEKDDDEPGKMEKARTMSLLANFIIKNDNPSRKDSPRIVQAHFNRDTNRSVFHLTWKTIFRGVRETVGIKK